MLSRIIGVDLAGHDFLAVTSIAKFRFQAGSQCRLPTPISDRKRRLRLFRAIELLSSGMSVTDVAMELGYGSASAFIYAFREEMGKSPHAFTRLNAAQAVKTASHQNRK